MARNDYNKDTHHGEALDAVSAEYYLRGTGLELSPEQIAGGVELKLAKDPSSTFLIYPTERLPQSPDGHRMVNDMKLSPQITYVLVASSATPCRDSSGKLRNMKGLRKREVVSLGRGSQLVTERFPGSSVLENLKVSSSHVDIYVDSQGGICITDKSTNGTEVVVLENRTYQEASGWGSLLGYTPPPAKKLDAVAAREETPKEQRLRDLAAKPEQRGRDRFGNDLDGRLKVTDQSRKDAALAYRFSGQAVKEIIDRYKTDEVWREEDIHKLVRNNEELRFELLKYLLRRLGEASLASRLPERLRRNTSKQLNYPGYPEVSSREAAALLALAILDGTYKRRGEADGIEIDCGEVKFGQHRWAAMCALGTEESGYAVEVMNVKRR